MCSLCGNNPASCEHCLGAMLSHPYKDKGFYSLSDCVNEYNKSLPEKKKFIGSGEDAHLFLTPLSFEQRCD